MRPHFVVLGLCIALAPLLLFHGGLPGQAVCQVTESDVVSSVLLFSGTRLVFASQPVVECDDGTRVQADSAEVNEAAGVTRFFGNVQFEDPTRTLTSEFAEFYDRQDRLFAWNGVVLTQTDEGTVMRGDTLEYYRASDFQPEDLLSMRGGRVESSLPPRSGTGSPYDVESDRLTIQGEDRVTAVGMVSVVRDSLRAWGDTMTFNPDSDRLRLGGLARIEGANYDLRAAIIELLVPGDTLREVIAIERPVLTTDGLILNAPREIRIDLLDGELQRLVAVGFPPPDPEALPAPTPGDTLPLPPRERPVAQAEDFVLTGDSLDIAAPGGVLDRVLAVGSGRGQSIREDSTEAQRAAREALPEVLRNDWIEGDTILALFVPTDMGATADGGAEPVPPTSPGDTALAAAASASSDTTEAAYRLDRLIARGNARSLYRVAPSDTTAAPDAPKAIHYVMGRVITVIMTDGEVERMDVEGPRGLHLEPRHGGTPSSAPEPDSLQPPPDSIPIPPSPGTPESSPEGERATPVVGSRGRYRRQRRRAA
jgi:lipopolysaccharide export system protein LptA